MTPPFDMPPAPQDARAVVLRDLQEICNALTGELDRAAGGHVLITGGAGFLGYYLVQTILHWNSTARAGRRIHVTVYDNYSRGVPRWLHQHRRVPELHLVEHDVTQPVPGDAPPFDYVLHAASIASPTYYRRHPIETMDANVSGLRRLLDYARERQPSPRPVRGFLFFSSSEIYGDPPPDQIPTTEDYRGNVSCTGPRACYDEAKRFGETLCVTFARHFGLPVKIARPFNNYGPGLKITDRRVIADFARDILAGRDITLYSDGSPTRTFCYVADAVVAYYRILFQGRNGEAYNVGVEEPEISVRELAERLAALGRRLFGYSGRVVHQPSPDRDYLRDNPTRRCPSIRKARRELGYEPRVALDEGLRRTLIWYAENRFGDDA